MAFISLPLFLWLESVHDAELREERHHNRLTRHQELCRERAALKAAMTVYTQQALSLTDSGFVANYRLNKPFFSVLCEELEPLLKDSKIKVPLQAKILATLCVYTKGEKANWWKKRDRFWGLAEISSIVCEVTEAINNDSVLAKYIGFPETQEQRDQVKQGFEEKFGLTDVVSSVGCRHISILRPLFWEHVYTNQHGDYSCNVLFMCDSDGNILNVEASHGGSVHDTQIWNSHPVKEQLTELNIKGETCRILGGSSYLQSDYLFTPSADTLEENHNFQLYAAQEHFHKTIKSLTEDWQCLVMPEALDFEPNMINKIITACCALHNMCNRPGNARC